MRELLLKDARVIDPSRNIDSVLDIAIKDGKIDRVEKGIKPSPTMEVYVLAGRIVTPALIDAHCHPVAGLTNHFMPPDEAGINAGVSLVNDGGSAGAANFYTLTELFKSGVNTAMTYFLNIATCGLIKSPEIGALSDIDPKLTIETINMHRDKIKGVKIRAMESLLGIKEDVFQIAQNTAHETGLPLMVHIGEFRNRTKNDPFDDFSRGVVKRLQKGDILSHFMTWRPGGMVTPDGEIYPELKAAQDRGVILDSSHGKFNFSFKIAKILIDKGILPDIITTDLSVLGSPYVQSLLVTMSKFLALGMSLDRVVAAVTDNAAKALGVEDAWGSLKVGRSADIAVLNLAEGAYEFFDGAAGNAIAGKFLLEPYMVFQNGVPRPVRSYYHLPADSSAFRV